MLAFLPGKCLQSVEITESGVATGRFLAITDAAAGYVSEGIPVTIACPHCGADNPMRLEFCQACGKALPADFLSTPTFTYIGTVAFTSAGRKLQGYELHARARQAASILAVVAVLMLIAGIADVAMLPPGTSSSTRMFAMTIDFGVVAVFVAVAAWATRQPMPAARIGLILYIGLQLITIAIKPTVIFQGIVVKIFIVVGLVRAIQAGKAGRSFERVV